MDNTWATPLYFKAFDHGVDVSIHAGTKYIGGHSDLMLGIVTARNEEMIRKIKDQAHTLGDVAGPDDCFLALRGLRTMSARLRRQQDSALRVARWLAERPEVGRVLHPALPGDPGHDIWKRDFLGASSLFGLLLHTSDDAAVERMVEALRFFMIGSSWGGYESLISLNPLEGLRTAVPWTESPHLLRLHIGLEDPGDLIADLEQALGKLSG
jgi:cystathionine beta-lyase